VEPSESGRAGSRAGETVACATAAALFAAGLAQTAVQSGWASVDWRRYPVFLPTGLLALSLINRWLRSRVLGWGLFAVSFSLFVMVFGAFVLQYRAAASDVAWPYLRSMALYLAYGVCGLYQLRAAGRR
jgi:hypothetical protein